MPREGQARGKGKRTMISSKSGQIQTPQGQGVAGAAHGKN